MDALFESHDGALNRPKQVQVLDLDNLPCLPDETPAELAALGKFPPLPPSTGEELAQLTATSSQPKVWYDSDRGEHITWNPPAPHWPDYDAYTSTLRYCHIERYTGEISIHKHQNISRREARRALAYHYLLRRYLRVNISLLHKYGEGLSASPTYEFSQDAETDTIDPVEEAQYKFAQYHAGIAQCLQDIESESFMGHRYGLPDREDFRLSRNYFSHSFLAPGGRAGFYLGPHVKQGRLYEPLLEQVKFTIMLLEEQLWDFDNWEAPSLLEIVQVAQNVAGDCDWVTSPALELENTESDNHDDPLQVPEDDGAYTNWFHYGLARWLYFRFSFWRAHYTRLEWTLWSIRREYELKDQQQDIKAPIIEEIAGVAQQEIERVQEGVTPDGEPYTGEGDDDDDDWNRFTVEEHLAYCAAERDRFVNGGENAALYEDGTVRKDDSAAAEE